MNKKIVILSIIIISLCSITPISAGENIIQEINNPLEELWNNFLETITYIFTHDPQHVIEESNEVIEDIDNITTNETNITSNITHHIHEENTIISEELNDSYVTDYSETSSNDMDKNNNITSE